jgi:lipid II:glycine glycyltransferase (peptidoglycan interpeptide bridge formation enzyme)
MIKLKQKIINEYWFASTINDFDIFKISKYKQYKGNKKFGFIDYDFYTKIISLEKSEEEILSGFAKNTKYEVNRAKREGVEFAVEGNLNDFVNFYNDFAQSKNLKLLNNIEKYKEHLIVTKALFDNKILSMHSYLVDKDLKRVRLLHSASQFRNIEDNKMRNLIGMANRMLHFNDMCYFKGQGFKEYDLGGYAYNTDDNVLKNINKFKDSFGGKLVKEIELQSIPFFLVNKLYSIYKGLKWLHS